ncbi:hypothetical protein [Mycobacteroides abscessus]|uniref:hypothetical protein n=1 Tax=Mycobacteroides abscessus TaxID=36809 RepID=UPI0009D3E541|nr:hypothetical protein [Mycobacteroides abscessus]SKK34961.1 Uncharacterised protein [Mycobacteroides abscessus subsp. abscessus]
MRVEQPTFHTVTQSKGAQIMGKHSKPDEDLTAIPEARLVEIRRAGIEAERAGGSFVDPEVIQLCAAVLDRRGEQWAASVLGRDISLRSPSRYHRHRPYLSTGEDRALVAADAEEDRISIAHLDPTN